MDLVEALRILRRRWPILVVGLVVGLVAGYLTAPGAGQAQREYRATATLIANPTTTASQRPTTEVNLSQAALLVTTGYVPEAVAAELDLSERAATADVDAVADLEADSLAIAVTDDSPRAAETRSESFANHLISHLSQEDLVRYEALRKQAEDLVQSLRERVSGLEDRIDRGDALGEPGLVGELDAAREDLRAAMADLDALEAEGPPTGVLIVIDPGEARVAEPDGIAVPDGKPQRAALLGAIGLLLGAAAAIALDRFDSRIHSKETAEEAFGVPVIAEIPPLPWRRRSKPLLGALDDPSSPFMESYRALRSAVSMEGDEQSTIGNGHRVETGGKVVVVVSAGAGEGKTTTVANLATALAEVGHSVLLVSADFRRPRLHLFFDVPREPGLTDVLGQASPSLKDLVRPTVVSGVRMLTSGAPVSNPAPLLASAPDLLAAARQVFDFVVVDTAPLLVANDATELLATADVVLLLARSGRTSVQAVHRTVELIDRMEVNVLGGVLVGATDTPTASAYYRYRYYADQDDPHRRRWRRWRRRPRKSKSDSANDSAIEPTASIVQ